jgi:hypothetical protein
MNAGRKQDVRSMRRSDEDDAEYLKRIHRAASKLYKEDPERCRLWYPNWAPKKKQTPEERSAKQRECQRRLYHSRKRNRTDTEDLLDNDS